MENKDGKKLLKYTKRSEKLILTLYNWSLELKNSD